MDPDPNDEMTSRRRPAVLAAVGAAVVVVIAAIALAVSSGSDDTDLVETGDDAAVTAPTTTAAPTTPTTGATTTAPPTTAAPAAEPAVTDVDLTAWLGTFEWEELVEDSDLGVVHRLELEEVANSGQLATGSFQQIGEVVDTDLRVRALPNGDGIFVEIVEIDRGKGIEVAGDVLFGLTGDPGTPTTTLRDLVTLRIDHPETGDYFLPVTATDEAATDDETTDAATGG
ncbi:MAG: hypothetical protein AAGA17_04765 [Actinomycetota bacterium]